jgi:small subunit ribosomal protein S11
MAKEQQTTGRAKVRKREKKNITSGVAHVNASFNNTMITITDAQGNTIAWSSPERRASDRASRRLRCQVAAGTAARRRSTA